MKKPLGRRLDLEDSEWLSPPMTAEIIFSGELHRVYASLPHDGLVFVGFDPWLPRPALTEEPFWFYFLRSLDLNVIGVKSSRNDWYQNHEIPAALEVILSTTRGRDSVGIGSSMGGYAAINFADALNLSRVIVFAPQSSPDPRKVPWDDRWAETRSALQMHIDRVTENAPVAGAIIYDPWDRYPQDARHAAAILQRHPLSELRLPFVGHHTLMAFAKSGYLANLLRAIISRPDSLKDAIAVRREARRCGGVYWTGLAEWLLKRGRSADAYAAAQRALSMHVPDRSHVERILDRCDTLRHTEFYDASRPIPLPDS